MPKIPQYELTQETLDDAVKDFESNGCLQLNKLFAEDYIWTLREEFKRNYEASGHGCPYVKVGHRRRMIPVAVEGRFNDPDLFAVPVLLTMLERILGEDFVLGSFTCVMSLPGAEPQQLHRDFPGLFNSAIDYFAPGYAAHILLPLVPLNQVNGATQVWPGTHRKPVAGQDVLPEDCVAPDVSLGSALLMDYRLFHRGAANQSEHSRPVLCLSYCRSWFIDTVNFPNISPLNISRTEYDELSEAHKSLFSRAPVRFLK